MVSDVMDTSKLHGQMMTKSIPQGKKIKSQMSGNHVIQYVTSDNYPPYFAVFRRI